MAAQRQYTTIFGIGGKILSSFGSAMSRAQARMAGLHKSSLAAGKSVLHLGKRLLGVGGILGGLAASKIFSDIFHEAVKEARNLEDRTRTLQQALLATKKVKLAADKAGKPGIEIADEQIRLMREQWELMGKNRVVSEEMYDIAAAALAKQGILPKNIVEVNKQLAKMVVYTHGVSANEEDMAHMAFMVARAIHGVGRGSALFKLGIPGLSKETLKDFSKLTSDQARYNFLMEKFARIQDFNAKASATGFGKLKILNNEMKQMSIRIGQRIEPALGELADTWRNVLHELEPFIQDFIRMAVKGLVWLAHAIQDNVIPALRDFIKWGKTNQTWLVPLGVSLGVATAAFIALAPVIWATSLAFGALTSPVTGIAVVIGLLALLLTQTKLGRKFVDNFTQSWVDLAAKLKWFDEHTQPYVERFKKNWVESWHDLGVNLKRAGKYITGQGGVMGAAPPGMAPPGMPLSPQARGAIQSERADIIKELQAAAIQPLLSATLATEASTAEGQKDILEALVNRAVAQKRAGNYKNIQSMITGGFYGPYNMGETSAMMRGGMSPARATQVAEMVRAVGGGRNELRGMTDQGMPSEILGYKEAIRGESYGFMPGLLQQYDTAAFRAGKGTSTTVGPTSVSFAPNITVHGNLTEEQQASLDARLRDLSRTFVDDFEEAQNQSRRLSYQGGY